MGKINIEKIRASWNEAKDTVVPLQNQGYLSNVPVEYIRPAKRNVFNENDTDEAIKELADDIAACGLQHPIAVNRINSENYRIISGERRFKAMTKYLHKKTVPCMIFENLSEEQEQFRLFMASLSVREYTASQKYKFYLEPESVKFKLPSKAERLINTAFSPKVLMFEFAPNGCRKTYIIKCLKHLISCEVQALFINRVSRIQVSFISRIRLP